MELKKFLKSKKIKFEEADISKDTIAAMEMIEKSKQSSVPVIEIDKKIIVGFNRKEIGKELGM